MKKRYKFLIISASTVLTISPVLAVTGCSFTWNDNNLNTVENENHQRWAEETSEIGKSLLLSRRFNWDDNFAVGYSYKNANGLIDPNLNGHVVAKPTNLDKNNACSSWFADSSDSNPLVAKYCKPSTSDSSEFEQVKSDISGISTLNYVKTGLAGFSTLDITDLLQSFISENGTVNMSSVQDVLSQKFLGKINVKPDVWQNTFGFTKTLSTVDKYLGQISGQKYHLNNLNFWSVLLKGFTTSFLNHADVFLNGSQKSESSLVDQWIAEDQTQILQDWNITVPLDADKRNDVYYTTFSQTIIDMITTAKNIEDGINAALQWLLNNETFWFTVISDIFLYQIKKEKFDLNLNQKFNGFIAQLPEKMLEFVGQNLNTPANLIAWLTTLLQGDSELSRFARSVLPFGKLLPLAVDYLPKAVGKFDNQMYQYVDAAATVLSTVGTFIVFIFGGSDNVSRSLEALWAGNAYRTVILADKQKIDGDATLDVLKKEYTKILNQPGALARLATDDPLVAINLFIPTFLTYIKQVMYNLSSFSSTFETAGGEKILTQLIYTLERDVFFNQNCLEARLTELVDNVNEKSGLKAVLVNKTIANQFKSFVLATNKQTNFAGTFNSTCDYMTMAKTLYRDLTTNDLSDSYYKGKNTDQDAIKKGLDQYLQQYLWPHNFFTLALFKGTPDDPNNKIKPYKGGVPDNFGFSDDDFDTARTDLRFNITHDYWWNWSDDIAYLGHTFSSWVNDLFNVINQIKHAKTISDYLADANSIVQSPITSLGIYLVIPLIKKFIENKSVVAKFTIADYSKALGDLSTRLLPEKDKTNIDDLVDKTYDWIFQRHPKKSFHYDLNDTIFYPLMHFNNFPLWLLLDIVKKKIKSELNLKFQSIGGPSKIYSYLQQGQNVLTKVAPYQDKLPSIISQTSDWITHWKTKTIPIDHKVSSISATIAKIMNVVRDVYQGAVIPDKVNQYINNVMTDLITIGNQPQPLTVKTVVPSLIDAGQQLFSLLGEIGNLNEEALENLLFDPLITEQLSVLIKQIPLLQPIYQSLLTILTHSKDTINLSWVVQQFARVFDYLKNTPDAQQQLIALLTYDPNLAKPPTDPAYQKALLTREQELWYVLGFDAKNQKQIIPGSTNGLTLFGLIDELRTAPEFSSTLNFLNDLVDQSLSDSKQYIHENFLDYYRDKSTGDGWTITNITVNHSTKDLGVNGHQILEYDLTYQSISGKLHKYHLIWIDQNSDIDYYDGKGNKKVRPSMLKKFRILDIKSVSV